jgi:16S rRNA (guanine527-N7)-methyltransferase
MVLAIMLSDRPGVRVHLVESIGKKCRFLEEVAAATAAPVEVHCSRAEALEGLKADVVTARALAPLDRLLELAFPFFRDDTIGLFLKGKSLPAELTLACKSWKLSATPIPSRSDPSGNVLRVTGLAPWRTPRKPS